MTLAEIYQALAAVENGAAITAAIQAEITKLRNEAATHRSAKQKVLQILGIHDSDDLDGALAGVQASLSALKSTGGKPDEIGRQLAALSQQVKELTDRAQAADQKAAQERDKRISASKLSAALAALQAGNATNPNELSKIVMANIQAKDDDSLVYIAEGKELSIQEGITAWLQANPWAVKNTQGTGAGSGNGSGGGAGRKYSKAEIEAMTPDQINANWTDIQASLADLK